MHNLRAVLWDVDGVLLEGSNGRYEDCLAQALEYVGRVPGVPLAREILGQHWSASPRVQLSVALSSVEEVEIALHAYYDLILSVSFFEGVRAVPGASEAVRLLQHAGLKQGIVTGLHHLNTDRMLKMLGLSRPIFATIQNASMLGDEGQRKPHPHMLLQAAAELGVHPSSTIYIGDSTSDLEMAIQAGALPVAVLTGNLDESSAWSNGAAHVLESARGVPALVAALIAGTRSSLCR